MCPGPARVFARASLRRMLPNPKVDALHAAQRRQPDKAHWKQQPHLTNGTSAAGRCGRRGRASPARRCTPLRTAPHSCPAPGDPTAGRRAQLQYLAAGQASYKQRALLAPQLWLPRGSRWGHKGSNVRRSSHAFPFHNSNRGVQAAGGRSAKCSRQHCTLSGSVTRLEDAQLPTWKTVMRSYTSAPLSPCGKR